MLNSSDPAVRKENDRLIALAKLAQLDKSNRPNGAANPLKVGNPHPATPRSDRAYHGKRFRFGEW